MHRALPHGPRVRAAALAILAFTLVAGCGDGTAPDDPGAATIQLGRDALLLDDGATSTLAATVRDRDGRELTGVRPTWRVADTAIVSITQAGLVSARRQGQTTITATSGTATASLDVTVRPVATRLVVVQGDGQSGITGIGLPDSVVVRLVDRNGLGVAGRSVRFAVDNGGVEPGLVTTDAQGRAATRWIAGLGAGQRATAAVDGLGTVTLTADATVEPEAVTSMLIQLDQQLTWAVSWNQGSAPNNPGLASYYQEKLAMLREPGLRADILRGRQWVTTAAPSRTGGTLPIVVIFPRESMRAEATESARALAEGLPVLEGFLGLTFPRPYMRVWEGFIMGNAGGGGMLFMEDKATYETRTGPARLPYEAILIHETSHSWILHESLNQFLELYAYNVKRGTTPDLATWTFTRSWMPGLESNVGIHALLDVYQLIGRDAMARAYRAVHPLMPQYGQALTAQQRQVFVDEAPAAVKAQVAAKMEKVQF